MLKGIIMNKHKEEQRCSRCTLPHNFRNITFDENGVCNYCHNHDRYIEKFRRFSLAKKNFLDQVEANQGKYHYDCAAGLSGGYDSTYVLYKLVRDYNLKVLAITYDNSFQSEVAKDYIKTIVDDLKVDHVTIAYDNRELHYHLYKESAIQVGRACTACSFNGLMMQRYCFDHKIPFFVHGRSRPQMLREISQYTLDPYLPIYAINYRPFNFSEYMRLTKAARKRVNSIMKRLIKDPERREEFKSKYFIDSIECERQQFVPQFIAFFLMNDYDDNEITTFFKKNVLKGKSKKLEKHHHDDCLAHPAFMYIYKQAFGWSLLEWEIAVDVREGKISRDHALELIENDTIVNEIPEESFDLVCSKMNITRQALLDGLSIARRNIKMHTKLMKIKGFFKIRPFKIF
jgi:hypothetical protein